LHYKTELAGFNPPACLFPMLLALFVLGGCATSQSRFQALRESIPLRQEIVETNGFRILLLERSRLLEQGGNVRVYIEGDGSPWVAGGELIAADPTPRKPLALQLMAQDERGALYLGRPCYFVGATEAPCSPQLWTSHRYSEKIVQTMVRSLSDWLARHPSVAEVSLVGYSGGGVLAVLIGERLAQVRQVVAVSAPLDHERWTELHAFSPLSGSLNVAKLPTWRSDVRRLAVFGADDKNVPYLAMRHALPPGTEVVLLPRVSHECCGESGWTSVLRRLDDVTGLVTD